MLSLRLVTAAALSLIMLSGAPARAQAPAPGADPVVAKANGVEIRESDLTLAEEQAGGQLPPMDAAAKRDYLIAFMTDMALVAKAADAKKLGDTADFKRKLTFTRNRLLMEALLQDAGKTAVNDAAMRKVYDEAVKQMGNEQEVRARHILVESEDEAKAILAELKKGTNFEELAKAKSKDPSAAAEGGDLGYFTKEQMVPEFSDVAFKMEKGQLSDPVKSQFGWHIIKVEDKRSKPVPTFEQVKPQLEAYVQRKAQAELVAKLHEGAKIEKVGEAPTPAAPAAPAAPAKK